MLSTHSALILVDVQQGFDHPTHWGTRNNPQAEERIEELLSAWRTSQRKVIHIHHHSILPNSPLHPSQDGIRAKSCAEPLAGEPLVTKQVNSGFIGTNLEELLRQEGIQQVVLCGFTTPHCVSTTTRMAGNLGFEAYVVADATVAYSMVGYDGVEHSAEAVHQSALAHLHQEFATVLDLTALLPML